MKETFKKVFNQTVLEPIIIFIVTMLTLEFLIYPGLSIDNTLLNILAGTLGVFLVLVVLAYADGKIRDIFEKKKTKSEDEKPNEDGTK